jgi:hypothetical protein
MRRSSGLTIDYGMSVYEPHPRCDTDLSGPAQIDTDTNTLRATIGGIEEGCIRVVFSLAGSRVGP